MDPEPTYSIKAFAQLAGVTVRTLHYYEEAGLLTPSRRTARGHRRYRPADLLRLQQILTLKFLGFSLGQIAALLHAPRFDVRAALRAQRQALEDDILRLQAVVYALTRTAEALEQADAPDWATVCAITRGLTQAERGVWASRYFPPEQLAWLRERAAATPPEVLNQGSDAWSQVYLALGRLRHLPPEHPEVQRLAAEMDQLIAIFTQGRPEVEQSLAAFYQDADAPPLPGPGGEHDVHQFAMQALAVYRAQRGAHGVPDS